MFCIHWVGSGQGKEIEKYSSTFSHPCLFNREIAGWFLLNAVNIYSSKLERDMSSLQVLNFTWLNIMRFLL